jgi:hypothetical protein
MATTRRELVKQVIGGATAIAVIGSCGDDGGAPVVDAAPPGTPDAAGTCTVYPQQTEGPFYLEPALFRTDITEGRAGAAMALVVTVIDASDGCTPLAGVAVDVWQCDAGGLYSGYPNQLGGVDTTGQTFLRGTQMTDAAGRAEFASIYPGWYPGRTTHIHIKIHPTPTTEATSQLYFPEATSAEVYATGAYAARGQKDTPNTSDGVFGGAPLVAMTGDLAGGLTATITVAVA